MDGSTNGRTETRTANERTDGWTNGTNREIQIGAYGYTGGLDCLELATSNSLRRVSPSDFPRYLARNSKQSTNLNLNLKLKLKLKFGTQNQFLHIHLNYERNKDTKTDRLSKLCRIRIFDGV